MREERSLTPPAPSAALEPRSAADALTADECARTVDFLWLSGGLAGVGAIASLFLGGNPATRLLFVLSVLVLVLTYLGFGLYIRRPGAYSPTKALAVVTVANLAGVAAALHFGIFSPAAMVLMVPIAYFGHSSSGAAAAAATIVMVVALAVPSLAITLELLPDPGMVQAGQLDLWQRLAYQGLVQCVLVCAFVLARTSRRSTEAAVAELERALRGRDVAMAQVQEAHELLAEVKATGVAGPLSGHQLGGWMLGVLLGRGASSDVYEGLDARGEAGAAVKVLRPELMQEAVTRLLVEREVSILLELSCPHIVGLLDYDLGDRPHLVMERLRGEDLGSRLRREGPLNPRQVADLLRDAALGLDAAHQLGIIHRDVKPSNLFAAQSEDGGEPTWKLLDFGIAAIQGAGSTLTAGYMLGTPAYMSPEQVRAERVNERTDQFSLACVAYRALTGRPAFTGANMHAVMMQVVDWQPVRPSLLAPVLRQCDHVLALGLAKDPSDRFEDALAFASALGSAVAGDRMPEIDRRARRILAHHPWDSLRV